MNGLILIRRREVKIDDTVEAASTAASMAVVF
jgi:hypothetical protein